MKKRGSFDIVFFQIYNRWGHCIFRGTNANPSLLGWQVEWDGRKNRQLCI